MNDLRKLAAEVLGPATLEERFGSRAVSAVDAILLEKQASTDPELMKVAASFGTGDALAVYESLGGGYRAKEAVSPKWIRDRVRSGSAKASPERLKNFIGKMRGATEDSSVHGKNWLDYDQAATEGLSEARMRRLAGV